LIRVKAADRAECFLSAIRTTLPEPPMVNVLETLVTRWRDYQASRAAVAELMELDPSEASRMAADYGLSVDDLTDLVQHADSAKLMERMMLARGLDPDEVRADLPAVLADMAVLCSRCLSKGRCEHELAAGTAVQHADEFCPNSMTMRALAR